jgi:hypothetical protein
MTLSSHERNIRDFLDFAQKNIELFTDEICASLAEILPTLPDDIEKISDAIALWCEKHPQIYDAFINLPITNLSDRAPGGGPTEITAQQVKAELDNRFRQSKPSSQTQPSSQSS